MAENNEIIRGKIMSLLKALKAGQSLANPGGLKVFTNYVNLAAGIAGIAVNFIPGVGAILTPDVIELGIAVISGFNIFSTTVTTTKIGL